MRRAAPLIAAAVLLVIAVACGEPTNGDATPAQESATATDIPDPTDTPPPPATDTVAPPPTDTPPPPTPTPPPVSSNPWDADGNGCHDSYAGACLDPNASDYDCAGGSGNGPLYTGTVQVVGPDVFDLDADGDGVGCE